ncbi:hypothetical protein BDZ89DRAFT_974934 [Hymenopellis radicata]|nr:hypothetical protein BDZ89DRAFT_974934 [Hymenopellis radicata]
MLGANQVPIAGLDDKRAFTLTVAVSGSGDLLPFQAIYSGLTNGSAPSADARGRQAANKLGFLFDHSGTKTYWANERTLKRWVSLILVPYWKRKMMEFSLESQECMLQLDVWSVHRKEAFQNWVRTTYDWIDLDFIPGGCTGLCQACDVSIQHPVKLSIRQSQQEDLLNEATSQLGTAEGAAAITFETGIKVIRDRSVQWLVDAYHAVNKPELVKKASPTYCSTLLDDH